MSSDDWEAARRILADVADTATWSDALYARWFHAIGDDILHYPAQGDYRAAHGMARDFESGWRLAAHVGGGAVEATRGGAATRVEPLDWLPADPARLAAAPGDPIRVRPRIDAVSGGFWHLWSRPWALRAPDRLVRVYAPVADTTALGFVMLFARTAPAATRWAMKILTGLHPAGRRDAAVIYLDRRHGLDQRWLDDLLAAAAPLVTGPGPRCTAPLAHSFTWANDPGGGRSHGQWLCNLMASVDPATVTDPHAFAAAVSARLAADGADPAAPHRGPDPR